MCRVSSMKIASRRIRIAEIKEKYIGNIISSARDCDLIDRVILFGSSTGNNCKDDSDIDLAVFGKDIPSRALRSSGFDRFIHRLYEFDNNSQSYDVLYFKTGGRNNSPILKEIDKGEVLYVRGE